MKVYSISSPISLAQKGFRSFEFAREKVLSLSFPSFGSLGFGSLPFGSFFIFIFLHLNSARIAHLPLWYVWYRVWSYLPLDLSLTQQAVWGLFFLSQVLCSFFGLQRSLVCFEVA